MAFTTGTTNMTQMDTILASGIPSNANSRMTTVTNPAHQAFVQCPIYLDTPQAQNQQHQHHSATANTRLNQPASGCRHLRFAEDADTIIVSHVASHQSTFASHGGGGILKKSTSHHKAMQGTGPHILPDLPRARNAPKGTMRKINVAERRHRVPPMSSSFVGNRSHSAATKRLLKKKKRREMLEGSLSLAVAREEDAKETMLDLGDMMEGLSVDGGREGKEGVEMMVMM